MTAAEQRYIVAGVSRLTVPVVNGLRQRRPDAEVVVVATEIDQLYGAMLRRSGVTIIVAEAGLDDALRAPAVDLAGASCLLALADSDLDNMRAAVICHAVAPRVPIVLRVFDRILSDQLEHYDPTTNGRALNVRRAYSMSALSAPKFIAAALGHSESHLLTMRFAEGEVPFLSLTLCEASPVVGKTIGSIEHDFGCAVIARQMGEGRWGPAPPDEAILLEGETIVIAGPEVSVFRLASRNRPLVVSKRAAGPHRRSPKAGDDAAWANDDGAKRRVKNITLLPKVAICLALLTMVSMAVVRELAHMPTGESFYWTLTAAASGAPSGGLKPTWLRVFAAVPIVAGGALAGVLFSYLASVATAQRLEQRMGRRARRMKGHVVLGGLGTVGYRVERLLWRVGVPTVVLELSPTAQFAGGVMDHAPVLQGDVRLVSNLERAGIRTASCLIAVTDDDLVNLEACLTARTINPDIKTVARVFDAALAERGEDAFGIDECLSAVKAATPAFVDAAADPLALRGFEVDGASYEACRYVASRRVAPDEVRTWRACGLRVVAFRHGHEALRPASALTRPLNVGDSAIVAGPKGLVERLAWSGHLSDLGRAAPVTS